MADDRPCTRSLGWRAYLIGALIVVLVAGVGGQWWVGRPKRSAGHFLSLLRKGQTDHAASMMRDASSIKTDAAGNLIIKAKDGTTVTLTQDALPVVTHGPVDPPPRAGFADYLAGPYRFQMSPVGPAVQRGQRQSVVVYCVVEANRIVIDTIREYVRSHGTTVWGFEYGDEDTGPVGVAGIDYGAYAYALVGDDEAAFIMWMIPTTTSLERTSRGSFGSVIGSFRVRHGRSLDFRLEPRYGNGTVTIAGKEYDCTDGRLFLTDGTEVKQLQRDPQQLAGILKGSISDFARRDPEISSFYGVNTQQSGASKAP